MSVDQRTPKRLMSDQNLQIVPCARYKVICKVLLQVTFIGTKNASRSMIATGASRKQNEKSYSTSEA